MKKGLLHGQLDLLACLERPRGGGRNFQTQLALRNALASATIGSFWLQVRLKSNNA
jgi:hypothetical protein